MYFFQKGNLFLCIVFFRIEVGIATGHKCLVIVCCSIRLATSSVISAVNLQIFVMPVLLMRLCCHDNALLW